MIGRNFYYLKTFPNLENEIPSAWFDIRPELVKDFKHPFKQISNDYIPMSVVNFFNEHRLVEQDEMLRCNWFKLRPKSSGPIHLDGVPEKKDTWAINWFLNWENTFMEWFKPIKDARHYETFNTSKSALKWEEDEVDLLESVELNRPCLVNIDTPHRMKSKSETWRFCLSTRITNEKTGLPILQDDIFKRLAAASLISYD